ncbi:MAG: FAD:protein FMN transferase [Leptospiraceae bacterium]|nr:FAD:protein FMN transferase [Leptospiraceae bacterium]MDW7975322.1 FAD:protein FMN transferase [Leptospiraceae bacterium]
MLLQKTLILLIGVLIFSCRSSSEIQYLQKQDWVYGTTFTVVIEIEKKENQQFNEEELLKKIYAILKEINHAFSLYESQSKINRLNRNQEAHFTKKEMELFVLAKEICKLTGGYFFPYSRLTINQLKTKKLLVKGKHNDFCDMFSVEQESNFYKIKKRFPFVEFDFNAIAKGYAVDEIKAYLLSKNLTTFLVEWGGEVCVGRAPKKSPKGWRVGIESPKSDLLKKEIDEFLFLQNTCLASSGNYAKKHIWNPFGEISQESEAMTISVFGPSCTIADAYATALVVNPNLSLYTDQYKLKITR